jgi:hypothetical protein
MTPGMLSSRIRAIPGINSVTRWQKRGADRLYIAFSVSEAYTNVWVDLAKGMLDWDRECERHTNGVFWRHDPHALGARAMGAVRELLVEYRLQRVAELKGGKT